LKHEAGAANARHEGSDHQLTWTKHTGSDQSQCDAGGLHTAALTTYTDLQIRRPPHAVSFLHSRRLRRRFPFSNYRKCASAAAESAVRFGPVHGLTQAVCDVREVPNADIAGITRLPRSARYSSDGSHSPLFPAHSTRCAGLSPCSDVIRSVVVLTDFAITDATTAHVTERDKPPPSFVPKHKAHAAKTLKERESTCSNKLRVFAQRVG
jgi:hypothetical protein